MSSTVMMERSMFTKGNSPAANAASPNFSTEQTAWCVVPRCSIKFEKCEGGFKIHCRCDDDVACATLQSLCRSLAGGMCSCCCTLNGITVCQCNLTCGITRCEYTKDGCCITCLSGDDACCSMLQSCCDTLACCAKQGCCCYVCINGTPICCAC